MWIKKIYSAGDTYYVPCNSVLKSKRKGYEAFTNQVKTAFHIKNSKRTKEAISLNYFISKSKGNNLEQND